MSVVQTYLQGKLLAEMSALMARVWRQMDAEAKTKYCCNSGEDEDASATEATDLSPAEKSRLIMRVAKRHRRDVCVLNEPNGTTIVTVLFLYITSK